MSDSRTAAAAKPVQLIALQTSWAGGPPSGRRMNAVKNIKFVVRVNRVGDRIPQHVQRIGRTPIQTTTNRKLALIMGRSQPKTGTERFDLRSCDVAPFAPSPQAVVPPFFGVRGYRQW
jgi:hypothetical protein